VKRLGILLLAVASVSAACSGGRTVLLKLKGGDPEALVYVDDRYVAKMKRLRAGIKLPPGQHRLTVEKVGCFPYDQLVTVDERPVEVSVELTEIPD
jgi:hypothetical protein